MVQSNVFNMDCMVGMKGFPDKFFELAIVDPPYGIGLSGYSTAPKKIFGRPTKSLGSNFEKKKWDADIPGEDYWSELFRVSVNQIVWGGNYFQAFLRSSKGWVFWYKHTNGLFADGELAWTSFDVPLKCFDFVWNGLLQENMKNKEIRMHPTQKPIALYQWLLKNYAKPGDKILDTHLGSGSSRIAAYKMGYDFWGYELDYDYWLAQEKRFAAAIAEPLFDQPKTEQGKLL